MTLDTNKPTDEVTVSEIPSYIREGRVAINAAIVDTDSDFTVTTLNLSGGSVALVIGVDLIAVAFEIVKLGSLGVSNISQIRGGTDGQIKLFIFQDNQVSFVDGAKATGQLYLNHLPVGTPFVAQQDDVIELINVGGDGASAYGYWKETRRQVSVK